MTTNVLELVNEVSSLRDQLQRARKVCSDSQDYIEKLNSALDCKQAHIEMLHSKVDAFRNVLKRKDAIEVALKAALKG